LVSTLSDYVASGLVAGCLYGLMALGLVLVHRTTGVLHFGYGEVGALGTFVASRAIQSGWPLVAGAALGTSASVVVATGFYLLVLHPARQRGAGPSTLFILTLGLAQVLQGVIVQCFGAEPERFPLPMADAPALRVGPIVLHPITVAIVATLLLACFGLFLLLERSRLGLALRATALNLEAAEALGLPTRALLALAWGLSAVLAVPSGILLAATLLLDPLLMFEPMLKGFAAAVLGGLGSLPGAVVGGLLLGLAESLVGAAFGLPFRNSLGFVVIVAVLLLRPEGLLGRPLKERV
jgi:branched-chain amino acid transport system permease protein